MKSKKPKRANRGLKRGAPLKNRKPLERRKGLAPGKPLERGKPLARGKKSGGGSFMRMPTSWRPFWHAWKAAVTAQGFCAVCGRGRKAKEPSKRVSVVLDPHHVLPARFIRRHVQGFRRVLSDVDYEALMVRLLFDVRNGLCVCRDCHEGHENRSRPIARALVPASAWAFADEVGMRWRVEDMYPE